MTRTTTPSVTQSHTLRSDSPGFGFLVFFGTPNFNLTDFYVNVAVNIKNGNLDGVTQYDRMKE